jgi:hypothetical protein
MNAPIPLQFTQHDLDVLGAAHEQIAAEVRAACEPEPAVVAASGAYGAAGATFTVALDAYLTRLQLSGEQLGQRYSSQGGAIRSAGMQLTVIDGQNAAEVPRPR